MTLTEYISKQAETAGVSRENWLTNKANEDRRALASFGPELGSMSMRTFAKVAAEAPITAEERSFLETTLTAAGFAKPVQEACIGMLLTDLKNQR
jgi:hypothetical protein